MPRYFFHIDSERAHRDEVGEDLLHEEAAWQSSVRMLRDLEHGFRPGHAWRLEVCSNEAPIFVISVKSSRVK